MPYLSSGQETQNLSVVIPTLGGDSLIRTIELLNQGTVVPSEILVCIPENEAQRVASLPFGNVKVIITPCRGQVAQRAFGFQQANHEFVLQLDDDIFVRKTCVQSLIACMNECTDVAVGPKLYDAKTDRYHSFMMPKDKEISWFERFLFWVINGTRGYEPGQIGRAGISMGVPEEPDNWNDLGWLPGGCVLHRKQNLVLFDFYPFKGKAFVEDLFHAVLLRRRNIRLMRCGAAACDVDFSSSRVLDPAAFIKLYFAYTIALKRLVKEIGGSLPYLYLYLVLNVLVLLASKLFFIKPKR